MKTTLGQLAALVQGTVHGDPQLVIQAARPLSEAQAGDITFLENDKHAAKLAQSSASAAVVSPTLPQNGKALIHVADPLLAFVAIVRHMQGKADETVWGVDASAKIHPTAHIGPDASIAPLAVIGAGTTVGARCRIHSGVVIGRNCKLGDDVVLYPNVVLYDDAILGQRVVVHANSVLGADGFGYRFQQGRHVKVPQLGCVAIDDDVEIGACSTIDRATFGATRIGAGTKIDNLVQVGHNCQIGKHNVFAGQVGFAGSTITGDYVVAAGQVGVADHVTIGAGVVMGAKAGVPWDIEAGQRVLGAPARPESEQKRVLMTLQKLPEMVRDVKKIKRHLGMKDE